VKLMESSATHSGRKPARRAGSLALTLLAAPLNIEILRHLEQGPQSLQDLRSESGLPPQSTMRLYLRTLTEIGTVERRPRAEFPTSVDYQITAAGRALLEVGVIVQTWLQAAPAGPKELGSTTAKSSIKALVEGWSSHLVRVLAARPLSLTELNGLIPRISYPSLERRLAAMRECNLVEVQRETGRLRPYKVTSWLQRAVGPITAAIAWERTHAPDITARVGRLDIEATFLLSTPLLDLPDTITGKCRLSVEIHDGASAIFAGVVICIEEGKVASSVASLKGEAQAWASGGVLAWIRHMNLATDGELELGGDRALARSVVEGLGRTGTELRSDKWHSDISQQVTRAKN
jgi:DNA-binding HxlR family transcriptional regulator